ncbi:MAG: crotonase/enoyl-CoA hydratase family protein [Acidimicrobiia bacterium]|nr:crotonase/enoyl-CoA hydratase family protein [Acidimicrobiia bacterium]
MAFSSEVLSIEYDGHVATLWLNRPDKRNAMNLPFWDDIPKAMEELSNDDNVRAVIIAARGKAFSVGIDLMLLAQVAGNREGSDASQKLARYEEVKRFQWTMTSIADCPKPVIAAVHGYCLGAGIDLITACDIRLASADSIFSIRETRMAMVADVGTVQRLPRLIGAGHVAELLYTGKDIDAARAKKIGLINDVWPDQEAVVEGARAMAAEIATNSPLAVQGAKKVLAHEADMSLAEALDHIALYNAAFIESHDIVEATTAFFEKRPPNFTGK